MLVVVLAAAQMLAQQPGPAVCSRVQLLAPLLMPLLVLVVSQVVLALPAALMLLPVSPATASRTHGASD